MLSMDMDKAKYIARNAQWFAIDMLILADDALKAAVIKYHAAVMAAQRAGVSDEPERTEYTTCHECITKINTELTRRIG